MILLYVKGPRSKAKAAARNRGIPSVWWKDTSEGRVSNLAILMCEDFHRSKVEAWYAEPYFPTAPPTTLMHFRHGVSMVCNANSGTLIEA